MKKKGFRIPFRAVACLTVLSSASFANAGPPAGEDHAAVDAGQKARALRWEQFARAEQESGWSWRALFQAGGRNFWLFDAVESDPLAESDSFSAYAPATRGTYRLVPPVQPQPSATMPTSGYLSTAASVNYSTAPWVITAGDGTYPDLGGVATFNEQVGTTPGTLPVSPTITLDVPVSLSGLTFNSVFLDTFAAGTNGALSLSTTSTNTLSVPLSVTNSPSVYLIGNSISAPIGGGGMYGLTKTGPGTVSLGGANTYTGGTFINGGTLRISNGDASLGTTGAGNDVTLNGGTLRISTTALTTARNFTLGTNNGTLELFTNATISGAIGGSGNLTTFNTGTLTLTAANTLSGSVTVLGYPTTAGGGAITLTNANGSLANVSSLDLSGTLTLTNSSTNNNNRVNDSAAITLRGGTISVGGNSGTATTEALGDVTTANGNSTITVTPNSAMANTLTLNSLSRTNNATVLVTGTSLGAASAAAVGEIKLTTAPTLVGGGASSGTTQSIVPWMVGNLSAGAVTSSSFVTYSTATGLRPLATSEYLSSATFTGASSTSNVLLSSAGTVPSGGITVNSVLVTSTAATALKVSSGNVLTIASGALLYSPSSSTSTTFAANLSFGTAEGVISTSNSTSYTLTLSGIISGSGGLTLNDFGSTVASTTANFYISGTSSTYTGTTTLLNGVTVFTGTISNDGATPSAFGEATSAIVINAGVYGARLYGGGSTATVINRDLTISGSSAGPVVVGTFNAYSLTLNGNLILNRPLTLEGGSTAATAVIINGNISGASFLTDSTSYSTYNILNGNNTYTGGTNMYGGTYAAGSDTAFGTGTIYSGSANATGILGGGMATRTLANAFVFENGTAVAFTFGGTAPLVLTGGINLNGNTGLTFTNTALTTMSGVVANGSLTKLGTGTLALTNANTYTGGTVISAGTLYANNTSGSGTGSGAISVSVGTLGGTGFITSPAVSVASSATIQGGTGANTGALTLNGNLTLVSGSIIELGLGSDGTNSSLARAGGVWALPSGIKFTFTGSPTVGQTYNNLLTGLAADPGTESGWTVTNSGFTGTFVYDGLGDINLTMTAVPEPATVLGGLACAGALGWHLRRRAQRQPAARVV